MVVRVGGGSCVFIVAGAVLGLSSPHALAQSGQSCPGYSRCPEVDYLTLLQTNRDAVAVDNGINATERQAVHTYENGVSGEAAKRLLGQLVIYDKTLSALGNNACAACHTRQDGETGGISLVNAENAAYHGSASDRSGNRKPMSYAYAPFAPVLHYSSSQQSFVGGNFWDMRATGMMTGNPAGDQSLDPPTNPNEMAMPDPGCVIYRISIGAYAGLFTQVWGASTLSIDWPHDTDALCSRPISSHVNNPQILPLSAAQRAAVTQDFKDMGLSVAAFEASPSISQFSSKFDAWQDGKASLTPKEMQGYTLFTGKANCSQCHAASGKHPLFTDYTAANIGVPRNPDLPYTYENRKDPYGYVANPPGPKYVDNGVGAFLAGPMNTNAAWKKLAPKFFGTFQVQTTRNVNQRERPDFVKDYSHNGFFKSLPELVHFYNTRDVLPRCPPGTPETALGVKCWPAPEQPLNENTTMVGNLGLSAEEEAAIVAFLGTLTDGYSGG